MRLFVFSVVLNIASFSSTIPLICVCDKPAEDDQKTGGVLRPLQSLQNQQSLQSLQNLQGLQKTTLRRHSELYKSVSSASTTSDPSATTNTRWRRRLISKYTNIID